MKSSGIGGQAVIEGVMMKNRDRYAIAIRKQDGELQVEEFTVGGMERNRTIQKIPIIRGIVNFVSSLVLGMKTLTYSASLFDDEEEEQNENKNKIIIGLTVMVAIVLAVGLFIVLPYGLSLLFHKVIQSVSVLSLIEGAARLIVFFTYIILISKVEDIQRVFMYHGAEHKCINCIEQGYELTVDNVRKSSRLHKRCGTSFLLIVMIVSVLFFVFIRFDSPLIRLLMRLILIPVIAGVSYEFIKLAGRTENKIVNCLSKPGLWLQKLTTREPDDAMIEVGMASVNAIFDWKSYQQRDKE
ncbi:MAG: DUF1385 domain-containing protein [Lachnospiraceae bacterium]